MRDLHSRQAFSAPWVFDWTEDIAYDLQLPTPFFLQLGGIATNYTNRVGREAENFDAVSLESAQLPPSPPPPTPFLANIPRPTILTLVLNVHDPHSANSMKPILDEQWPAWPTGHLSRKTATTFGRWTIPELSTSHIGKGVALVAQTAAFVYIYVRISQIGEMTLSFHATPSAIRPRSVRTSILSSESSTHLLELVSELTMVRKRKERVVCSAQHHEEQERRRESQRTTVNL